MKQKLNGIKVVTVVCRQVLFNKRKQTNFSNNLQHNVFRGLQLSTGSRSLQISTILTLHREGCNVRQSSAVSLTWTILEDGAGIDRHAHWAVYYTITDHRCRLFDFNSCFGIHDASKSRSYGPESRQGNVPRRRSGSDTTEPNLAGCPNILPVERR